ncbi:MAG: hypothetical protein HPY83_05870 [Anaerolineae bacterium]|nr:hypothetical protein [Anaerolineae bacterium]
MLAGFAKTDITPPAGTTLTGYLARLGPAEGVHDPLFCRALVLGQGVDQAALIVADTLGFGIEYTRQVKDAIAQAAGIAPERIILAATHTHAGPASVFLQGCGDLALDWLEGFPAQAVSAVQAAQAGLTEVSVHFASVDVPDVAINRRDPENGPVDEELSAVWFQDATGRVKGALMHFTCHAVVMDADNRLISADYPGAACRQLEELIGAPAMFVQGPCGDINPAHRHSFEAVDGSGAKLARAAAELIRGGGTPIEVGEPAVQSTTLALPLMAPPPYGQLLSFRREHASAAATAEAAGEAIRAKMHRAMVYWADLTIGGVCSGLLQGEVTVEAECLRLGDILLVTSPGELFVEFGLEAKRRARQGGKRAMVVAYANADIGYIPTASSYAKGGYEVEWAHKYYGYPGPLAPEAGEMVGQALAQFIG